jgi:hypothetical protein
MNLNCKHRQRCYEYKEAVAIAMGDSFDEKNNISQIQAEVRIISEYCSKCKKLEYNDNEEESTIERN